MCRDGPFQTYSQVSADRCDAQIADGAVVPLQAAATQVGGEAGLDAGECICACSVEAEGVVAADDGKPCIVYAASWALPMAAWGIQRRSEGFSFGW